jgi:hypothetical protein
MDVSLEPVDSTLHRHTNSPKVHINAATYCTVPCRGARSRGGADKIPASACIRCRRISRPSRRQGRTRPDTPDTRTQPEPLAQRTAPQIRKYGSGRGPCHLWRQGNVTLKNWVIVLPVSLCRTEPLKCKVEIMPGNIGKAAIFFVFMYAPCFL